MKVQYVSVQQRAEDREERTLKEQTSAPRARGMSGNRPVVAVVVAILGAFFLLGNQIGGVEERLTAQIGGVEERLTAQIGGVEERLTARIVIIEEQNKDIIQRLIRLETLQGVGVE